MRLQTDAGWLTTRTCPVDTRSTSSGIRSSETGAACLDQQEPLPVPRDVVCAAGISYWDREIAFLDQQRDVVAAHDGARSTPTRMSAPAATDRRAPVRSAPGRVPPPVDTCQWPPFTSGNGRTYTSNWPESFASYASQRPSGEMIPLRSVNGVRTRGVTRPVPSNWTCMTSWPVFGAVSVKVRRVPSSDTATAFCWFGLSVSRSTAPEPSAACQNRFRAPVRSSKVRAWHWPNQWLRQRARDKHAPRRHVPQRLRGSFVTLVTINGAVASWGQSPARQVLYPKGSFTSPCPGRGIGEKTRAMRFKAAWARSHITLTASRFGRPAMDR